MTDADGLKNIPMMANANPMAWKMIKNICKNKRINGFSILNSFSFDFRKL